MTTFTGTDYALDAATLLAGTSTNEEGFERWWCPTALAANYTCYRFQPTSTAEKDGDPRFSPEMSDLKAYFYDFSATGGSGAFIGGPVSISTLTGATTFAATITAIVALFISF